MNYTAMGLNQAVLAEGAASLVEITLDSRVIAPFSRTPQEPR